jgi:patatin-like phospholipase domain-containing protein 2
MGVKLNASFAGCGFIGIYHVGACSCLLEHAPHLLQDRVSGTSAGALVSLALVAGIPLPEMAERVLRIASVIRQRTLGPLSPTADLAKLMYQELDEALPDDIAERASGRMHVALTRVHDMTSMVVSQYDTKEDVIQVILGASFIPYISGWIPPKYKGVRVIDGVFSNNRPVLDDQTITVSPFVGNSDICPKDDSMEKMINSDTEELEDVEKDGILKYMPGTNKGVVMSRSNIAVIFRTLKPPHPHHLMEVCKQGYKDALGFLTEKKMMYCDQCVKSGLVEDYKSRGPTGQVSPSRRHVQCVDCAIKLHNIDKNKDMNDDVRKVFNECTDSAGQRYTRKVLSLVTLPITVPMSIASYSVNTLWSFLPSPSSTLQAVYNHIDRRPSVGAEVF